MKEKGISTTLKKYSGNLMLAAILVFCVVAMSLGHKRFLSMGTFSAIAYQFPEMGLLTLGMMVTMITGGINLSCIASANLSGILMALMMTRLIPSGQDSLLVVVVALVVGIIVSVAVGVLNGVVIACFKVPPILATLGTQMLVGGLCILITKGAIISGYPPSFLWLGNGNIGPIPVPLIIFMLCAVLMAVVLLRTPLGAQFYMYGSNSTATEFSGVSIHRMLIKTYALSGFFVGIAAIVLTSRFSSAAAGYAESFLLQSVLMAVLGGVNPNGGSGKVSGVVFAVLILQVVASGLNLLRISPHLTTALWGAILLMAVAMRSVKKM